MIFSSYGFVLLFLPIVLLGYFGLNRFKLHAQAKLFLVGANLFFYGWFNVNYLWLILASIGFNFVCGRMLLAQEEERWRKTLFFFGLAMNLGLLGYYKYFDFFISNINRAFSLDLPTQRLLLPLAISFFTFQQLAYLAALYQRKLNERYTLTEFALFVTFFPQLIAGPIVLSHEMMPQFAREENFRPQYRNLAAGSWIFAIGMAKKLIFADYFAVLADSSFGATSPLMLADAWGGLLGYTCQIYFDFSGYCDMAIGLGLMFNIQLPVNFDSPYKAQSIKEFWQKWHISLGRFLAAFVYYPLGGSRKGNWITSFNLFITFVVCGIWHGAGWCFVIFGVLQGLAMALQRWWSVVLKRSMPRIPGIILTMVFFVATLTVFRAESSAKFRNMITGLFDFSAASLNYSFDNMSKNKLTFFIVAAIIIFGFRNAVSKLDEFKPTIFNGTYTLALLIASLFCMSRISPFIYFNF